MVQENVVSHQMLKMDRPISTLPIDHLGERSFKEPIGGSSKADHLKYFKSPLNIPKSLRRFKLVEICTSKILNTKLMLHIWQRLMKLCNT